MIRVTAARISPGGAVIETRETPTGRVIGGILDPAYDHSYYTLVPCPLRGTEVDLEDHRACENFGGVHLDPATGAYLLYCRHQEG
jgi:hypothetical protein